MKVTSKIILLFTLILVIAGCSGAATAPPLDLPAPATGRITIGAPDANGKSTITGGAGSVPGGANVMAINESLAASLSPLWMITDKLVATAYAAIEDCGGQGRYVVQANEDGSFVLIIDAAVGDSIILVLIDEDCNEISERISFYVPEETQLISDQEEGDPSNAVKESHPCAGELVEGGMIDLINMEGNPVAIFEGYDTYTSKLLFGATEVTLSDCYCTDLTMVPMASGEVPKIVVASYEDQHMWVAWLDADPWDDPYTLDLGFGPKATEQLGISQPRHIAVAHEVSGALRVSRVSIDDGTVDIFVDFTLPGGTYELVDVVGISTIGEFFNGGVLGAVVIEMYDTTLQYTNYFLGFFESDTFSDVTYTSTLFDLSGLLNSQFIADFKLAISDTSSNGVYLLVSDSENQVLRALQVISDVGGIETPITLADTIASFGQTIKPRFVTMSTIDLPTLGLTPIRLASGLDQVTGMAETFVLTDDPTENCKVWRLVDFGGAQSPSDCMPIAGSSQPYLIDLDENFDSVLIGDVGLNSVLAPSIWY